MNIQKLEKEIHTQNRQMKSYSLYFETNQFRLAKSGRGQTLLHIFIGSWNDEEKRFAIFGQNYINILTIVSDNFKCSLYIKCLITPSFTFG